MDHKQSDMYNPDLVFDEEGDTHSKHMAHNNNIVALAGQALQKHTRVYVVTSDETFNGYVHEITPHEESHIIMGLNLTGESVPVQWGVLPTVPRDSTLDARSRH